MPYITDPFMRDYATRKGMNPDDPSVAQYLLDNGRYIGPQPNEGFGGNVQALAQGFGRGLVNTVRGLADIPGAIGEAVGIPGSESIRVAPKPPSLVEQVNPIASGLGEFGSFAVQFIAPETLIGRVGAVSKLSKSALIAERLGSHADDVAELVNIATKGVEGVSAESRLAATANLAEKFAPKGGFFSGFGVPSVTSRAVRAGATFGILGAAQSGSIEDRLKAGAVGTAQGALFGGLSAPSGLPRLQTILREAASGAVQGYITDAPPISGLEESEVSPVVGQAFFGAILGGLTASPFKTKELARAAAIESRGGITEGGSRPPAVDIPEELSGLRRTIFERLLRPTTEGESALDRLLKARDRGELDPESATFLAKLFPPTKPSAEKAAEGQDAANKDAVRTVRPTEQAPDLLEVDENGQLLLPGFERIKPPVIKGKIPREDRVPVFYGGNHPQQKIPVIGDTSDVRTTEAMDALYKSLKGAHENRIGTKIKDAVDKAMNAVFGYSLTDKTLIRAQQLVASGVDRLNPAFIESGFVKKIFVSKHERTSYDVTEGILFINAREALEHPDAVPLMILHETIHSMTVPDLYNIDTRAKVKRRKEILEAFGMKIHYSVDIDNYLDQLREHVTREFGDRAVLATDLPEYAVKKGEEPSKAVFKEDEKRGIRYHLVLDKYDGDPVGLLVNTWLEPGEVREFGSGYDKSSLLDTSAIHTVYDPELALRVFEGVEGFNDYNTFGNIAENRIIYANLRPTSELAAVTAEHLLASPAEFFSADPNAALAITKILEGTTGRPLIELLPIANLSNDLDGQLRLPLGAAGRRVPVEIFNQAPHPTKNPPPITQETSYLISPEHLVPDNPPNVRFDMEKHTDGSYKLIIRTSEGEVLGESKITAKGQYYPQKRTKSSPRADAADLALYEEFQRRQEQVAAGGDEAISALKESFETYVDLPEDKKSKGKKGKGVLLSLAEILDPKSAYLNVSQNKAGVDFLPNIKRGSKFTLEDGTEVTITSTAGGFIGAVDANGNKWAIQRSLGLHKMLPEEAIVADYYRSMDMVRDLIRGLFGSRRNADDLETLFEMSWKDIQETKTYTSREEKIKADPLGDGIGFNPRAFMDQIKDNYAKLANERGYDDARDPEGNPIISTAPDLIGAYEQNVEGENKAARAKQASEKAQARVRRAIERKKSTPAFTTIQIADLLRSIGKDEQAKAEIITSELGTTQYALERAHSYRVEGITDSIEGTIQLLKDEGISGKEARSAANLVYGSISPQQRKRILDLGSDPEAMKAKLPEFVYERIVDSTRAAVRQRDEIEAYKIKAELEKKVPKQKEPSKQPATTLEGVIADMLESVGIGPDVPPDLARAEIMRRRKAFHDAQAVKKEAAQTKIREALRRDQAKILRELEAEARKQVDTANEAAKKVKNVSESLKRKMAVFDKVIEESKSKSPRRRLAVLPLVDRYAKEIETLAQELRALDDASVSPDLLASHLESYYNIKTGVEPGKQIRLREDLAEIDNMAANMLEATADLSYLKNAPEELNVATAREALAAYGSADLSPTHLAALPHDLRLRHVSEVLASTDGAVNQHRRFRLLFNLLSDPTLARENPVSASLVSSKKSGRFAFGALNKSLEDLKTGLRIEPTTYLGATTYKRLYEPVSGREWFFRSYEEAALAADQILSARRDAADFDIPGTNMNDPRVSLNAIGPPKRPPVRPKDGFDGEHHDHAPAVPKPKSIRMIEEESFLRRHIQVPIYNMRKWAQQVEKITGIPFPLDTLFDRALTNYSTSQNESAKWKHRIADLMDKHKIKWDTPTANRLARAAQARGDEATTLQKTGGIELVRSRSEHVMEGARRNFGLKDNEVKFLRGMDDLLRDFFKEMNISEEQYHFYYPRMHMFARGIRRGDDISISNLMRDPLNFFASNPRARARAESLAKRSDPIRQSVLEEFGLADVDDYFDTIKRYIDQGIRVKHVGDSVQDLQTLLNHKVLAENGVELGTNIHHAIDRAIGRLLSIPAPGEARAQSALGQRTLKIARGLKAASDALASAGMPDKVVNVVTDLYKRLGMKVVRGDLKSMFDVFTTLHRTSTFGANPMRAIRDSVTTDLFFLYPRFGAKVFGQAFNDTAVKALTNPKEFKKLVDRMRKADMITNDEFLRLEQADAFGSKLKRHGQELLSWMYRANDLHTRILAFRASEIAVEKAYKSYKTGPGGVRGNWGDFLSTTGLDTYDFLLTQSQTNEIKALLDRGNIPELAKRVGKIHEKGAVFQYLRPNAPAYYDYAVGRLFGQYSVWPVNAVNSMWGLATSPYRHHEGRRAVARSVTIATRYALAAEAAYAAGAALGVDTSDWIPFLHNTLSYRGGPGFTLLDDTRRLIGGDPIAAREFNSYPGRTITRLVNNAVPIIPDVAKKAYAQIGDPSDWSRRAFGLPMEHEYPWDRFTASLGFAPSRRPLNQRPPVRGPLYRLEQATIGQAQDLLSEGTGILPKGTE